MILDLEKFIRTERPYWEELEALLEGLDANRARRLSVEELQRYHYLYQRAGADLGKLATFSAEQDMKHYLESLVARAYAEIHDVRDRRVSFSPRLWLFEVFPRTVRRHFAAAGLSVATTLIGVVFGAVILALAPQTKPALLPFSHLHGTPSERVAREQRDAGDQIAGHQATFSTTLMANNIRVSIFAMALGVFYGAGTLLLLFYNGVILGAVGFDYVQDGQAVFLAGWLLPHGSIEIPAILVAGQAGLVLAHAAIGWGDRSSFGARVRAILPDLTTLIGGTSALLVWAGIVEAFFSQYHEPLVPYAVKIAFGALQLLALTWLLASGGRAGTREREQ